MHADILCQEVYVSVSKISCVPGPPMCKINARLLLSLVIPEVCRKYSNLFFHFFHRCAIDAGSPCCWDGEGAGSWRCTILLKHYLGRSLSRRQCCICT